MPRLTERELRRETVDGGARSDHALGEGRLSARLGWSKFALMSPPAASMRLGRAQGAHWYFLRDRPISGGDVVQMCTSGGWIMGRFDWDSGVGGVPTFYFSVELDGGGVALLHFPIPERALLRRA